MRGAGGTGQRASPLLSSASRMRVGPRRKVAAELGCMKKLEVMAVWEVVEGGGGRGAEVA